MHWQQPTLRMPILKQVPDHRRAPRVMAHYDGCGYSIFLLAFLVLTWLKAVSSVSLLETICIPAQYRYSFCTALPG